MRNILVFVIIEDTLRQRLLIDDILGEKFDVLLVRPSYEKISIMTRLRLATCTEDFFIFYHSFVQLYPTYK